MFDVSVIELALRSEDEQSLALLQSVFVAALENSPIREALLTDAILLPGLPLALINPRPIRTIVLSVPMWHVLVPLALVVAAITVNHEAETLPTSVDEVSNVVESLWLVEHNAQPMPDIALLAHEDALFGEGSLETTRDGLVVRRQVEAADGLFGVGVEVEEPLLVEVLDGGWSTSSGPT